MPVSLITRRRGKIIEKYGLLDGLKTSGHYQGGFTFNHCRGRKGDSGGIIINPEARIVGMIVGGYIKLNFDVGISFIRALEFIYSYKEKIKERGFI